jgi:hypothetical protein
MPKSTEKKVITIQPIPLETVVVPIKGMMPLIVHKWSDKAKRQMLANQMAGKNAPKAKKEPKDPQADYMSSLYLMPDGEPGFPSSGFKAAIVGACRMFDGLDMVLAKTIIRVNGYMVKIEGEHRMREDPVRLAKGVPDLRYRAEFPEWSATLSITYNASILKVEDIISLVNAAGMGGIGEWRPSAPKSLSGTFGTFEVDTSKQIETRSVA